MGLFLKKSLGSPMPLVQRIFFLNDLRAQCPQYKDFFLFENFSLFWERFGNLEFFFEFKKKKYIYIYTYIYMNKVHQMLHEFLEFKELGSKDLGFYVFRTLNCIVGKP